MGAPRDWLVVPAEFGVAPDVRLRSGDPFARSHARLCHDSVVTVRTIAAERGWDHRALAERLAVNPRYLQRKLSGHLPITMHDLVCWTQVLGLTVTIT